MAISDANLSTGLVNCGLLPALFTMSGQKSMRGPCPKCGGERRLVVFLNGAFPRWFVRCDLCGFEGWAPHVFAGVYWPKGPIGELPAVQPKDYSRPLQVLRDSHIDAVLHDNLTDEVRLAWRRMGISDKMQDFWKLGYVKGRPFRKSDQSGVFVADAYSIPKYAPGWELRNVDFRMIDVPPEEGKYRPFPGAPPAPFLSRPDMQSAVNPDGQAFIFEGAKKAAVSSIFLDGVQTVGVPSANSWAGAPDMVKSASVVYVILDPNAWQWARKMCAQIGPQARMVTLPGKIDDSIVEGTIDRKLFMRSLTYARREGGGFAR